MKKISIILFVLIMLFATTGIVQAEPTLITRSSACISQGDKATISYYRALCDDIAENVMLFQNGFLRPANPSDVDEIGKLPCPNAGETAYLCFGVPWEGKIY